MLLLSKWTGVVRRNGNWIVPGLAILLLAAGLLLSRCVEPGVRVEKLMVDDVPVLRFQPRRSDNASTAQPYPVALLAHGISASKETLFRAAEALAAGGFVCYAADFTGHGQSRQRFAFSSNADTLATVARAAGRVDVFVGHSMGAYAGAEAVRRGYFSPRLFVAMGALPQIGSSGPPLLLLAGRFEEAIPLARLTAEPRERLIVSPWSDHALEPYDPVLVNALVRRACDCVGSTPPDPPLRWILRFAGMVFGVLGALGLAFSLPRFPHSLRYARGPVVSVIMIAALVLTADTWIGTGPSVRHLPLQAAGIAVGIPVLFLADRLRVPRWAFAALPATGAVICMIAGAYFLGMIAWIVTLVVLFGMLVGAVATHNGVQYDGSIAMIIFIAYALGQWFPAVF